MQQAETLLSENYVFLSAGFVPTSLVHCSADSLCIMTNHLALSVKSTILKYILIDTLSCKVKLKVVIRHVFNGATLVYIRVLFYFIWQESISASQHSKLYIVHGHYFDIQSDEINITIFSSKQQPYNVSIDMFLKYNVVVCVTPFPIG